jgi:hypothetical protein
VWRKRRESLVNPEPLLSGKEIANILEIEPGSELGHAIDELTEAQIRNEVRTAASARRWLRRRPKPSS